MRSCKVPRAMVGIGIWVWVSSNPIEIAAAHFDQLVVFGDSLSDTGNLFAFSGGLFPPSTPTGFLYDNGRFSNGPVWVEFLAPLLGASIPAPSLMGGTNFSWGGARSAVSFEPFDSTLDPDPFPISSTVSIRDQVGEFLMLAGVAGAPDPDSTLYVVWGGANDFLIGNAMDANAVANTIATSIKELIINVGAMHLLVANSPSLLDTPGGSGGFDSAFVAEDRPPEIDDQVITFNTKLGELLGTIATENSDVKIYEFDVFSLYKQAIADPLSFGFNPQTGIPALNEAVLYGTQPAPLFLNDPASSLFWDSVHPTTLAHRILAQKAAEVVMRIPEPSGCSLLVTLGMIMGAFARRACLARRSHCRAAPPTSDIWPLSSPVPV